MVLFTEGHAGIPADLKYITIAMIIKNRCLPVHVCLSTSPTYIHT